VLHWIAPDPKRLNIIKYLVAMHANFHVKNKVCHPCVLYANARVELMPFPTFSTETLHC